MSSKATATGGAPELFFTTNETARARTVLQPQLVLREVDGTRVLSSPKEDLMTDRERLGIYDVLVVHVLDHTIRDVRVIAPNLERAKLAACAELQLRPDELACHAFIVRELGTFVSRRTPPLARD